MKKKKNLICTKILWICIFLIFITLCVCLYPRNSALNAYDDIKFGGWDPFQEAFGCESPCIMVNGELYRLSAQYTYTTRSQYIIGRDIYELYGNAILIDSGITPTGDCELSTEKGFDDGAEIYINPNHDCEVFVKPNYTDTVFIAFCTEDYLNELFG